MTMIILALRLFWDVALSFGTQRPSGRRIRLGARAPTTNELGRRRSLVRACRPLPRGLH